MVIIFLVQKGYGLDYFGMKEGQLNWLRNVPNAVSYGLYILVPLISTWISISLSSKLGRDEFKEGETISIEYANNSFLPSYLGYFFVALSIGNCETLVFVYILLFIFTFLSQALYFNPLFLIFGYEFYNITTRNGTTIFLITKKKFKKTDEVIIPIVFRINDYTFFERG